MLAISFILLFFFFAGYPNKQYTMLKLISVLYVIWGILFHHLEGDLHWKIVIEYMLIAVLALILLKGVIFS